MRTFILVLVFATLGGAGCGESSKDGGAGGSSGAVSGGASASGGASTDGARGGAATGGAATGGSSGANSGGSGGSTSAGTTSTGGAGGVGVGGSSKGGASGSGGSTGGSSAGGSGGDPLSIGSSVPRDQFATTIAKVRCAIDRRCGLAFSKLDAASCVERAVGFDPIVKTVDELIERGKLSYDPARMAACLTFLRDRECDRFGLDVAPGSPDEAYTGYLVDATLSWAANPACRDALLGDVAAGGGCFTKLECASGICELPSGNATCGSCVAPLARGDACVGGEFINGSYFDRCGLDDYCNQSTNRCVARLAEGATCSAQTQRACALGLKCVTAASGGDGTCQSFAGEGDACAGLGTLGGAPCANWLYCSSTCRREVGPLGAVGDTCASGEHCLPGLVCDGAKCRGPSAGNAACFASDDPSACVEGFFCNWDFTSGVCQSQATSGKACTVQQACPSDLACLSETSTCGVKKGVDAACSTLHGGQGECQAPLVCLNSTASSAGACKRLGELDEACANSEGCAAGLTCMSGKCRLAGYPYLGCP